MFIEVHGAYNREDDEVDYDSLGVSRPDDYEPDWAPTLVNLEDVYMINPSSDGYTTIRLKSDEQGLLAKEPYEEVRSKVGRMMGSKTYVEAKEMSKEDLSEFLRRHP